MTRELRKAPYGVLCLSKDLLWFNYGAGSLVSVCGAKEARKRRRTKVTWGAAITFIHSFGMRKGAA